MSSPRLGTVSPNLVALLRTKEPTQLGRVAGATVDWVFTMCKVDDPRARAGRAALAAKEFGDSPARSDVLKLAQELDEIAWRIQDENEATGNSDYLDAFSRARAVTSLWYALAGPDAESTMDCVYEAGAASDDFTSLREVVVAAANSRPEDDYLRAAKSLAAAEGLDLWTAQMRVLLPKLREIDLPVALLPILARAERHWHGQPEDLQGARVEVWEFIDKTFPQRDDLGSSDGRAARALLCVLHLDGNEEERDMTVEWFVTMSSDK